MLTPSIPKNHLVWQCRRGMLELDNILNPFLEECYQDLNHEQQCDFVCLLKSDDPSLYSWIYCIETPPNDLQEIVNVIHTWRKTRT